VVQISKKNSAATAIMDKDLGSQKQQTGAEIMAVRPYARSTIERALAAMEEEASISDNRLGDRSVHEHL